MKNKLWIKLIQRNRPCIQQQPQRISILQQVFLAVSLLINAAVILLSLYLWWFTEFCWSFDQPRLNGGEIWGVSWSDLSGYVVAEIFSQTRLVTRICPVGWVCKMNRLCKGIRHSHPTCVLDMTLNNLMVRFL